MRVFGALVALWLCSTAALAAPATEASIKELLAVTESRKVVAGMQNQMEGIMENASQEALHGGIPTPGEQQAITNMKHKVLAVVQAELAWDKLEPLYLRLYQESFSADEVAGMLAFYKTPAGKAVIHKLPTLTQKMLLEIQSVSAGVAPKMQQIQEEFLAEIKAAKK